MEPMKRTKNKNVPLVVNRLFNTNFLRVVKRKVKIRVSQLKFPDQKVWKLWIYTELEI